MHRNISVIIPTYNREKSIMKSIDSVLTQTYPIAEVIIADDGSTDHTEELICGLNDSRVRYCRLPDNRGAGGARNYGVEHARHDLIAFQDSDDKWFPDKIEKQMQAYTPGMGMVYTGYRMYLQYGIEHIVPDMSRGAELEGYIFENLLVRNTIGAPTVLMSKEIFEEVGGFDETMRSLEDWDFALKVAQKYPIGFVPEPLLDVQQTQGGVSANMAAYYQSRCYMLRKFRKEYIETNTLNLALEDIIQNAKLDGIQQQVEKMLVLYLS